MTKFQDILAERYQSRSTIYVTNGDAIHSLTLKGFGHYDGQLWCKGGQRAFLTPMKNHGEERWCVTWGEFIPESVV